MVDTAKLVFDDEINAPLTGKQDVVDPSRLVFDTPSSQVVHDERTGKNVSLPAGLNGTESQYLIDKKINGTTTFIGQKDVGTIADSAARLDKVFPDVFAYPRFSGQAALAGVKKFALQDVPDTIDRLRIMSASDEIDENLDMRSGWFFTNMYKLGRLAFETPEETERRNREAKQVVADAKAMIKMRSEQAASLGMARPGEDAPPLSRLTFDIFNASGNLATMLGLTAVTRTPVAPIAYAHTLSKTQYYQEMLDADMSHSEAKNLANLVAVGTSGLEMVGTLKIFSAVKANTAVSRFIKGFASEGATEGAQQAYEETVFDALGIRDKEAAAIAEDVLYSTFLGGILGGGASAGIGAFTKKQALDAGLTPEQADGLAKYAEDNIQTTTKDVSEFIRREADPLSNDDPTMQKFLDTMARLQSGNLEDTRSKLSAEDKVTFDKYVTMFEKSMQKKIVSDRLDISAGDIIDEAKLNKDIADGKSVAAILDQQKKLQDRNTTALQNEIDYFKINTLRELEFLKQEQKGVDPELMMLLDSAVALTREKRKTPKNQKTLSQFLAAEGGLREDNGELRAIGVSKKQKLRNDAAGMYFDEAALAAYEAGYFDTRPTVAEFLEAVNSDVNTQYKVYRDADISDVTDLQLIQDSLDAVSQRLDELGVDSNHKAALRDLRARAKENTRIAEQMVKVQKTNEQRLMRLEAKLKRNEENPPILLADKLRTFKAGLRKGKKLQKTETKEVQAGLIDILEASGLPAEDKAKFISTIKNIQTVEQLDKNIDTILDRVERLRANRTRKELVESIRSKVKKAGKSNSISVDFVKQIQSLLNEIDLKNRRPATIQALQNTLDYMKRNPDANMPKDVLQRLEILNKRPLKEITLEELQAVEADIDRLVAQGKLKLKLLESQREARKQKWLAEIADGSVKRDYYRRAGSSRGSAALAYTNFVDDVKQAANKTRQIGFATNTVDIIMDMLDGSVGFKGPNYRVFKKTVDIAFGKYLNLKEATTRSVKDLHDRLGLKPDNYENIGMWAALQQEGGRERLLASGYTKKQLDNHKLSSNEMTMYTEMRSKLDALRPAIEEVMRLVYNKDLDVVDNYFPFLTDFKAMGNAEITQFFTGESFMIGDTPAQIKKRNVEKGFTQSRTGGKQPIRVDAMSVFLEHVDNAAYLIEMGADVKALGELAASDTYGEIVGDIAQEFVVDWTDLLARKGRHAKSLPTIDTLRTNLGAAILAFRLGTVLIQPSALILGMTKVNPAAMSKGIYAAATREGRKFARDNMPEVRERVGDDPYYMSIQGRKTTAKLQRAGFWALTELDKMLATAVALGAYTQSVEAKGGVVDFNNPDTAALLEAQLIMRRTQSSAFFKDAPPLLTQGKISGSPSVDKALFQFQSFMLSQWGLIKHDFWNLGVKSGDIKEAVNVAVFVVLALAAEQSLRRVNKEIQNSILNAFAEDDEELAPWADTVDEEAAKAALSTIPFVSQLASTIEYGGTPVPIMSGFNKLGDHVKWAAQAETGSEQFNRHAASAAFIASGIFVGLPGTYVADQLITQYRKKDAANNE